MPEKLRKPPEGESYGTPEAEPKKIPQSLETPPSADGITRPEKQAFPPERATRISETSILQAPRPKPIGEHIRVESGRQSNAVIKAGYKADSKSSDELADVEAALIEALDQKKETQGDS